MQSYSQSQLQQKTQQLYTELMREFFDICQPPGDRSQLVQKALDGLQSRIRSFLLLPGNENGIPLTRHLLNTFDHPTKPPVILDIGCYIFGHYFGLMSCFENFNYIGIDFDSTGELTKFYEFLSSKKKNFKFINAYVQPSTEKSILQEINQKVDLVLLEQIAVGGANNPKSDLVVEYLIGTFIPSVLSASGSFHIESASNHQDEVIEAVLNRFQYPYIKNCTNYICGHAAQNEKIIELCSPKAECKEEVEAASFSRMRFG